MVDKVWSQFTIARAKFEAPIVPFIADKTKLDDDEVLRRLAQHDVTPEFIRILEADHRAAKDRHKLTKAEVDLLDEQRERLRRCDPVALYEIASRYRSADDAVVEEDDDDKVLPRKCQVALDLRRDRVEALFRRGMSIEDIVAQTGLRRRIVRYDLTKRGLLDPGSYQKALAVPSRQPEARQQATST